MVVVVEVGLEVGALIGPGVEVVIVGESVVEAGVMELETGVGFETGVMESGAGVTEFEEGVGEVETGTCISSAGASLDSATASAVTSEGCGPILAPGMRGKSGVPTWAIRDTSAAFLATASSS